MGSTPSTDKHEERWPYLEHFLAGASSLLVSTFSPDVQDCPHICLHPLHTHSSIANGQLSESDVDDLPAYAEFVIYQATGDIGPLIGRVMSMYPQLPC